MSFRFFSIVCNPHRFTSFSDRYGSRYRNRNAFVRRAKNDIKVILQKPQSFGVCAPQTPKPIAVVDGSKIEEVRALTAGFERKWTKLKHPLRNHIENEMIHPLFRQDASPSACRCSLNSAAMPVFANPSIASSVSSSNGAASAVP